MTDFELLLSDRLQKIRSMNELYDLENGAYVSFSGGKDSAVLSELVDMALPGNGIPRVYIDTSIEYRAVSDFVRECAAKDKRIVTVRAGRNITAMLKKYGYPFKSKEHSQKVASFQSSGRCKVVRDYLGEGSKKDFLCPVRFMYNFTSRFSLKVSDRCCWKLKKEPASKWEKENGRTIAMTGIRKAEGGLRRGLSSCAVFYDSESKKLHKFYPLLVVPDEWMEEFIRRYGVKLCSIYSPPFSFKRTGCKGCPYGLELQEELDVMERFFPAERRQCESIWGPVYEEYRRIGYRLKGENPPVDTRRMCRDEDIWVFPSDG